MRYVALRVGDSKIWRNSFEEEEFPWRRSKLGLSFLRAVSVMLIRPWAVSRVKDGMAAIGNQSACAKKDGDCQSLDSAGIFSLISHDSSCQN